MPNGLAQQGQQGRQGSGQQVVEEIMMLLQQGVTPEELMQKGVPQEIIEAAMAMLQQMAAQQQQGEGLAGRSVV